MVRPVLVRRPGHRRPYGPYRQSERKDIYRPYVDKIVENGHGFRCFCTPERLDEMRAAQRAAGKPPKYDGRCLNLTAEEVTERDECRRTVMSSG
jgi:glutamyl-tRNA synthetase